MVIPKTRKAPGVLALALLALPACALAQQPSWGPLTTQEGGPLYRFSYTATTEPADVVGPGQWATELWVGFSNVFEQDSSSTHVLLVDMERLITAPTVRWGAAPRLELGGTLTLETTGAGAFDGFLVWYHGLLHLGQGNRDVFPRNEFHYRLSDGSGTPLLRGRRKTLGLEDVRLFAKWQAARSGNGRSTLSLKAETRIPGSSNPLGEESTDFALIGLGRLGVGAWYLHGSLGLSTRRASASLAPILHDGGALFAMLGVERSLGSHVSAIVQYQTTTPALDRPQHREIVWAATDLVFGVAGGFGDHWRWDVSFQEDVPPNSPATDFSLGMQLRRVWH